MNLSWTDAAERYSKFCLEASLNENLFNGFRRNPIFTQIMEHFTQAQGLMYFNAIKGRHPELLDYFDIFKSSDEIGSPMVYEYNGIYLSPSTLRYIKVFSDIFDCFGDLEGFNIIEIGGGYGGQCKIIKDIYNVNYSFVDLPEVNHLAKKYLSGVGINDVRFYTYEDIFDEDYDLVISNHAFSELNKEIQDYYNNMIIKRCKRGFMTCNIVLNGNSGYQLEDYNKIGNLKFMEERPNTHPDNFILYWNE